MKHLTTKFLVSAVLSALTVSCGSNAAKTQVNPELIEKQLQEMTLREKVGQLFCVRPEAFDVALEWDTYTKIATYQLQAVNEQMVKVNAEYPAGGIILFAHNIKDEPQLAAFMKDLRAFNGDPLFYVDEEGGRVARIGNNENFQVEKFPAMGEIGKTGDTKNALRAGKVIGGYLCHYGFDVDLAPVADVNTNPKNPVIGARAFSDDPRWPPIWSRPSSRVWTRLAWPAASSTSPAMVTPRPTATTAMPRPPRRGRRCFPARWSPSRLPSKPAFP